MLARDHDQNDPIRSRVSKRAQRQWREPEEVTATELPAATADALELDLAGFDLDDRAAPCALVVGELGAGRDDDDTPLEGFRNALEEWGHGWGGRPKDEKSCGKMK